MNRTIIKVTGCIRERTLAPDRMGKLSWTSMFAIFVLLACFMLRVTSPACFHKTTNDQCCRIPFKYKGVTYHSCTSRDHDRPWCSLTRRFNQKKGKKHDCACAQETTSGECCSFPFEYKGKTYDSCTMVDGNRPWCSLTPIYDKKRRRDCLLPQPPPCSIKTTTGECCSIPFKYKGKTYDSCTLVDLNTPWCSLDPVYNGTRGNCASVCNQRATTGGCCSYIIYPQ
ncbi:72 kDa type IV collagenase-like [Acropora muricata]|uniref:72 kDa type IV collagenase-like n=1 Tax=Acropora muricata TaxID=159855 RepID=UPI0034E59559